MGSPFVLIITLLLLGTSASVWAQSNATQECTAPLTTLLTCLNYVQGKAKIPPEECCTKLMTVHLDHPKCLCELIEASESGGIAGLPPLNPALAMKLPVVCQVPAKPSRCPGLLGIPASSPEAQIFFTPGSSSAPQGAEGPSSLQAGGSSGRGQRTNGGASTTPRYLMLAAAGAVTLATALLWV